MKKYIVVGLLAFLAVTGAVIEGLVELSPQLTQLNGLVMIICTAGLITWTLTVQSDEFHQD